MKEVLYVMQSGRSLAPAPLALWLVDDGCLGEYQPYAEMVQNFDNGWRLRYDEAEAGDLADWLETGPFYVMRYYTMW